MAPLSAAESDTHPEAPVDPQTPTETPAAALPPGRKRKWDVQTSDSAASSAAPSPSSSHQAIIAPSTDLVKAPGVTIDPSLALVALPGVPTSKRFATVSVKDAADPIALTAAATTSIVARLSAATRNAEAIETTKISATDGEFTHDYEINDVRNRYMLTKGHIQQKIKQDTNCDVTTRGKYYSDRSRATPKDPPLYLHLNAASQDALDKAIAAVEDIINQAPPELLDMHRTTYTTRSYLQDKIPVDIDAPPNINLRAKIVGPGGAFMKHIQLETNTRVQLRGRGSGFVETNTGQESDDPMTIHISGSNDSDMDTARRLCEDLVDTVRKDVERILARMHRPSPHHHQQQYQQQYHPHHNQQHGHHQHSPAHPAAPSGFVHPSRAGLVAPYGPGGPPPPPSHMSMPPPPPQSPPPPPPPPPGSESVPPPPPPAYNQYVVAPPSKPSSSSYPAPPALPSTTIPPPSMPPLPPHMAHMPPPYGMGPVPPPIYGPPMFVPQKMSYPPPPPATTTSPAADASQPQPPSQQQLGAAPPPPPPGYGGYGYEYGHGYS